MRAIDPEQKGRLSGYSWGWDRRTFLWQVVAPLAVILIYDLVAHWPFPFRLLTANNLFFEYPLVLVVLGLFFTGGTRLPVWRGFLPGLVVLLPYVSFDLFLANLKRSPRPSDLQNISLVFDFAPWLGGTVFAGVLAVFLAGGYCLVRLGQELGKVRFCRWILVRSGLLVVLTVWFHLGWALSMASWSFTPVVWSDFLQSKINGRVAVFLHNGEEERAVLTRLESDFSGDGQGILNQIFGGELQRRPAVHIVVLESLFDPRVLADVKFTPSPLAAELEKFLVDGERFSLVNSPIYGGLSAQAEFELLTGVPALGRVASVEFNVMRGGVADGFVRRMRSAGYFPDATIASSSSYFNAAVAYDSLGFDSPEFLDDAPRSQSEDGEIIFDGVLFKHNLAKLDERLAEPSPVFNYVVGMYGHFPFARNRHVRPDVVDTDSPDVRVKDIGNQFYYRTRALASFLEELITRDPECVIYVTSDHQPPLANLPHESRLETVANPALLLVAGRPVDVSGRHYFEIPWLIWHYLTGIEPDFTPTSAELEEAYLTILAGSMNSSLNSKLKEVE